ncbi:hypothetical protein DM860_003951 [Cuscuta australis]|uniref:F-box domain-containing protein n=1 Tax=Cuscuta australis TaxID=267555 RepID=A0A328CYB6_9ASTE|nr:hypothetical protein DM860_003951 [Cuscuta australis]
MRGAIDSSMMAVQRTTAWVAHILCMCPRQNKGFDRFPDDILVNILSRLPADAVLQCRKVCRHWRTLTSSTHFITVQNRRAPSVILLEESSLDYLKKRGRDYYVYDAVAKKLTKISFKSNLGFKGRAQQFYPISLYDLSSLLHAIYFSFDVSISLVAGVI